MTVAGIGGTGEIRVGRVSNGRQFARVSLAGLILGVSWLAGGYLSVALLIGSRFCDDQSAACAPRVIGTTVIVMPIACLAILGLCSGAIFYSSELGHRCRRWLGWAAGLMLGSWALVVLLIATA